MTCWCDLRVASESSTFGQPEEAALAWARELAGRAPGVLEAAKRAIKGSRALAFGV